MLLLGIHIPLLVLAVYWSHGILLLLLDLLPVTFFGRYKIQPNVPLDMARLPGLVRQLLKVSNNKTARRQYLV